jgi:hypothetical protein
VNDAVTQAAMSPQRTYDWGDFHEIWPGSRDQIYFWLFQFHLFSIANIINTERLVPTESTLNPSNQSLTSKAGTIPYQLYH